MHRTVAALHRYCRRFHPVVWLLVGGELLESLGRFMVRPFLALYLHQQGTDLGIIGLVLAVGPLANLATGLLGGTLADRWGRRPMLALSTLGGGLALMAFGLVSTPAAFGLLNFLNTAFRAMYRPANHAALADVTPKELRMEAYGLRRVSLNIGAAVGPLLGFWFFSHAPTGGFLAAGGITLALGLLVLAFIPETRPAAAAVPALGRAGGAAAASQPAPAGTVLMDGALWLIILSSLLATGVYRLFDSFVPIAIEGQVPAWVYPAMLTLNATMVILLQLPLNMWLSRFRMGGVLLAGGLLYAAGWAGLALPPGVIGLFLFTAIFTLGEMVHAAGGGTFIAAIAPEQWRARFEGLYNLRELGPMFTPLLGGALMRDAGSGALFLVCAGVMLLAGWLGWWADRVAGARTAPAARVPA